MTERTKPQPDAPSTEQARRDLQQAEAGDLQAADRLHQAERRQPASAEAAEQVESDGPGKRGVAR